MRPHSVTAVTFAEDWIKHFQNLLYDKKETQESHTVVNPPSNIDETTQSDEILNGPITVKEIHDQISELKNKKSARYGHSSK